MKKFIDIEVKPNTYAVLTLKQSVYVNYLVKGDRIHYEKTFKSFIRGLTKRVYGCNNYKKRLLYLCTLEGGDIGRFHINLCIRRPDWLPLDDFRKMIADEWIKLEWAMPEIYVEDRYADCVGYSLKEGSDSLLDFYTEWADSQGVLFKNRQRRRKSKSRRWFNPDALSRVMSKSPNNNQLNNNK